MIRIAVVDDEKYVCAQLKRSLLEYQFKYNLDFDVDIFLTCEDLYERLQSSMGYHLIFLDIEFLVLSISLDTFYSNKNYAARKI